MKDFPDHIFRGYDLRGVYGKDFDDHFVNELGKGYGTFLKQRRINKIVVGHDVRVSSPDMTRAFIDGVLETGVDVINLGMILTQMMYFAQYKYLTKGGAMITASHNPSEYNGMKLGVGFSDTMISEEIQEFKNIVKSKNFIVAENPGKEIKDDVFPSYKSYLMELFPQKLNFKVVIDGLNATPSKFLPEILRTAGCEVIEQNTELDGTFPLGTPDPTESEVLERLAEGVKEHNADIGFTYDSDGDRVGIVDKNGEMIWNDILVAIFAKDVIEYLPGAGIVYNTLCSKMVSEVIEQEKGRPIIWKTGHSFIKSKLKEERAAFGGELSGHFFFVDNFFGHDDGAYASLRLLNYLQRKNKNIDEVVSELPKYISSPEIKVGCPDNIKFKTVDETIANQLRNIDKDFTDEITIDGIRLDWDTGMIIVRASQNGPYLTVKFEAKSQDEYDELKSEIKRILEEIKVVDFASGVNLGALE